MMKGFMYRAGNAVKDYGERMGRVPMLRFFSGRVIRFGMAIMDRATG